MAFWLRFESVESTALIPDESSGHIGKGCHLGRIPCNDKTSLEHSHLDSGGLKLYEWMAVDTSIRQGDKSFRDLLGR